MTDEEIVKKADTIMQDFVHRSDKWSIRKMINENEIANTQFVGVRGDTIVVLMPKQKMTKREALVHAAWIVALVADTDEEFQEILKIVRNT